MQPGMFVVDDDADIRETLRLLLEDAGYSVNEASNGENALRMLRGMAEPHIVLLDQYLPGLSGGALLQTVATDAVLRSRHGYVLLTATSSEQARQLAESVPRMDVAIVTKPFDVDDLLETIMAVTVRLAGMTGMSGIFPDEQPRPMA